MSWFRSHLRSVGGLALAVAGVILTLAVRVYLVQVLGTAAALAGLALLWSWAWPLCDQPARWPRLFVRSSRAAEGDAGSAEGGPDEGLAGRAPSAFTWQRLLIEASGPFALLVLLAVLYHPLLAGQFPWQADHTVHQAKAWLLSERLLPSGRILGWTHQSGAGYPAEVLYPPLGDLWMAVVRYGTFKQLSWNATYALGLFGVIAFGVLSFYYIGRRLFGPLAGLLAGLFVLTDMGGFREGGYVFTLQYGVWPLHLGIVLAFLALLKLHAFLATPAWRGLAGASLLVAAALLCHPVALIFFLVALPLVGLFALWQRPPGAEPVLGRALAAACLGVGLAAFWLLPFVVKAPGFSAHVSNYWKALPDIAGGLVGGDLWQGAWAWPTVMGGLGAILALRERRPVASFLVALAAALLVAASLTIYSELRLANWIASARFVQFQRFVIFVKLIAFLLGGYLAQRIFVGLSRGALDSRAEDGARPAGVSSSEPAEAAPAPAPAPAPGSASARSATWRRGLRLGVVALLAAPFVLPLGFRLVEDRLLPVSGLTTPAQKGAFVRDFKAVLDHVCAEAAKPATPFFRVAFSSGFNDHEMANAALFCPVPEVKLSFIPSETFRYRAHLSPSVVPRTQEDLEALNVRFVVGNSTSGVYPWLRPVMRRGRVTLHEVPLYAPDRFTVLKRVNGSGGAKEARYEVVPPGTLDVKVTRFEDEEIRVRAGAVPPDHFLVLHVAHFANWRARRGDAELPLRAHDLTPRARGLMLVPLAQGLTVFEYRRLGVDFLGWGLTLLALLVLCGLGLLRVRPSLRAALLRRLEPRYGPWRARLGALERPARFGALGLVAIAAAILLYRASGGGSPPADRPRSLTHELDRARVSLVSRSGQRLRCRVFQMGRWICGKGRRYVGPVAEEWNLKNRLGLWAHPDESGALEIEFPDQVLGRRLEIDYGILQSGGAGVPVTLVVHLDGKLVGEVSWPRARGPAGWAHAPLIIDTADRRGRRATLRFTVSAPDIGGRHFVFDPRIVP